MRVGDVIAEIMKRERVKTLFVYPLTPLTEFAAAADIRPIVVRQERVGCAMADAVRPPELERRCGGVRAARAARASRTRSAPWRRPTPKACRWWSSSPGRRARWRNVPPSFNATLNYQHITKSAETVTTPEMIVPALRRAFTLARNGRPGPCLVEVCDVFSAEIPSIATPAELDYEPTKRTLIAPDPKAIDAAADALLKAKMPMIYAGQGVHYAKAWPELRQVAELLEAPVGTSMEGKSAFPETHPLALGAGGPTMSRALATHVRDVGRGLRRRRELQPRLLHPMARRRTSASSTTPWTSGTSTRSFRPSIRCSAMPSSRWRCCTRRSASGCAASRAASRARSPRASRRRTSPGSRRGCRS